jgi:hypothetical protein
MSFSKFDPLTPEVLKQIGEFCIDNLLEDIFPSDQRVSRKRKRRGSRRVDYWSTPWGIMLRDKRLEDERSEVAKIFRLRFRIPFLLFRDVLLPTFREKNIFPDQGNHRVRVPLEFKILASLRILGRGNCVDDISELSHIPNSSVLHYFHRFVDGFVECCYDEFVRMPEGEDLAQVMEMYSVLGFPGAVGSMDATHVRLGKCPNSYIPVCKGKEGYPSLAWMCVVDHSKEFRYVGEFVFGATPDKSMCNTDPFLNEVEGGKYRDTRFFTLDDQGKLQACRGGYFITDAGMIKRACYVDPMKQRISHDEIVFAEWLESIRKDVECAFGILKMRFRILLNRVEFHSLAFVDRIFRCCAILHNMLVRWDGRGVSSMMTEEYWERQDPDAAEWRSYDDDASKRSALVVYNRQSRIRFHETREILRALPMNGKPVRSYVALRDYLHIRWDLTAHFTRQYKAGLICKPTSSAKHNKVLAKVMERVEMESFLSLIVKTSSCETEDGKDIGLGLFAGINYRPTQKIAYFRGDVIPLETYDKRQNQRYGLQMGEA